MKSLSEPALVHRFFSGTGDSYDIVAKLCTLGFDVWWKKKILQKIPPGSSRLLDQASGTGILTFLIARKFPEALVSGVELRKEYLDIAVQKARTHHIENVSFYLGRAEDVVLNGAFDCISSSYLAKYADLDSLVKHAKEMLRDNGLLIMHDFTYPSGRLSARLWRLHFKLLQNAGGRIYPQWKPAFYGLPDFLKKCEWTRDLLHSLKANGFKDVQLEPLTFHTSAIVSARKAERKR